MYASLPDAYKHGDAGDRQVVTGFMAFVMGVVAMFRVGKIAPKRAMDAAMGIATMEAMAKNRKLLQAQQGGHGDGGHGPGVVAVSAAQFEALVKRVGDLEEKVAALSSRPPEMPGDKAELLAAAATRLDALEAELESTKKVTQTHASRFFSRMFWNVARWAASHVTAMELHCRNWRRQKGSRRRCWRTSRRRKRRKGW
jgi:hypothetical protein